MGWGLYRERGLQTPEPATCELVELDGQLIPALLSAIAGRLGPSHWESPEAWAEGYSRLSWQGAQLLMGCKEDIITEVRALRDGTPTHAPYDLATYPPGTWPGTSLTTISNQLYAEPDTAAELLVQIRDRLDQLDTNDEAVVEGLYQIALLLGV